MINNLYSKVTVIIPEHNRPEHLKRLITYYLSYGLRVLVVDSSNVEFKYLAEFRNEIIYRFYPNKLLAEKLFEILPLINSPYVFMCANDDFIVPETVNYIIDFLEQNADYNSGQGIYTDFTPIGNHIETSLRYKNTINIDLNEDSSIERLNRLQRNYFQYYYCVFRTVVFKKVICSVINNGQALIKNLCLLESYISSYTAIDGKHIIIPVFYAARENIIDSAASQEANIPAVITQMKFKREYKNYVLLLAEFLAEKEKIEIDLAKQIIHDSVMVYIVSFLPHFYTLKAKVIRFIKPVLKIAGILKIRQNYIDATRNKRVEPVPTDMNGLEHWQNIETHITRFKHIYNNN